jgi:erythronate-4-phosphate dehydrogenase
MKIIIDDKIPYIKGVFEHVANVIYLPGNAITSNDVKDADAIITRTRTICNQQLLEDSSVKFIATATIGYDHIDTQWCEANGIKWTNAAGCNSMSVTQWVAAVLVHLAQKHNFDFKDKTLGVVGVGNVGRKVVRLAESLGMQVVLCDPPVARNISACGLISLDGIMREADIITFHVPLNLDGIDKTYHLIDEQKLKKLRPETILINSSRGEVIDNKALKKALAEKKLLAAALDVWENEPDIDAELLDLLDIATPHIAGYSADGKANGTTMSVRAVSKFFQLGLDSWSVHDIPAPQQPEIEYDAKEVTNQQLFSNLIQHTYNIVNDDNRLRNHIAQFEEQRGSYPLRREFAAYTVRLSNASKATIDDLKRIGFKVIAE